MSPTEQPPNRDAPTPIPTDVHEMHDDILRIGNRAAAEVQESNRRRFIPNGYSLRGRLVSDASSIKQGTPMPSEPPAS